MCGTGDIQRAMHGADPTDRGGLWHLKMSPEKGAKGREAGQH